MQYDTGIVGLGVMGQNLALNVESRGDRSLLEQMTAELLRLINGKT